MKLGLGTVQFGLSYGISNSSGQTPLSEVKRILAAASRAGVQVLDTAALYGTSEEVLGESLQPGHGFKIVTKTCKGSDPDLLEKCFNDSLRKLKQERVFGLLMHQPEDAVGRGAELLVERMRRLKQRGLVEKIGVSIYSAEQIDAIFDRFDLNLVQIPLNVLDQRLIQSGHLARLKAKGVEVHVRSAFLQGLLLMDANTLSPHFDLVRAHLKAYRSFLSSRGTDPLQAALGFVVQQPEVDAVVCGVNTLLQFEEILAASRQALDISEFDRFAWEDPSVLNPSNWKL